MRPPSKNPIPSAWLSELNERDEVDVLKELPSHCDIAIIGAGMTGCALAYHLSEINPNLDIVVLEARDISGGASGRNGGISWPSSDEPFELQTASEMREFCVKSGCEVCYHNGGGVSLVEVGDAEEEEEDTLEHITKIDPVALLNASSDMFSSAYFDPLVASFWPAKFVRALARASQPCAKYVTNCTVIDFEDLGDSTEESIQQNSDKVVINTNMGSLHCNRVVVATNAWIPQLLPQLLPHFEARMNTVLCSNKPVAMDKSNNDKSANQDSISISWETISALSCGDGASELYMSVRYDGRLILGGLREVNNVNVGVTCGQESKEEEEEDVPAGDPVTIEALQSWLHDKFPLIADQCSGFSQTWYGVMGFPSDNNPIVGRMPRRTPKEGTSGEGSTVSNVFVVSACCGHGMPRCYGVAKILARQLTEVELDELQTDTYNKFNVSRFFE